MMNDDNYTIICTFLAYGSETLIVPKDEVRKQCERLKALNKLQNAHEYMRIEVVNNETGEIREYWNNHDNKINF